MSSLRLTMKLSLITVVFVIVFLVCTDGKRQRSEQACMARLLSLQTEINCVKSRLGDCRLILTSPFTRLAAAFQKETYFQIATSRPKATTTPKPTTTPKLTTTPNPTTTLKVTTIRKATTTPKLTTTPKPTTTPKLTTTPNPTTTLKVTTIRKVTTTPKPTTTLKPTTKPGPKRNCLDVKNYDTRATDGIFSITSPTGVPVIVRCDMTTANGGWLIFLRRVQGGVNFNRTWDEYKQGFGDLDGDFWWGNEHLHEFTSAQPSEMRIDMWDWEGNHAHALYNSFLVDDEAQNYTIHTGSYSGDAGDAFHNRWDPQDNMPFSTYDHAVRGNCAVSLLGGFWYNMCGTGFPNGVYHKQGTKPSHRNGPGVEWFSWKYDKYYLKEFVMSFRPKGSA
ncbi:ficolin-1-A-like isoform X2 [Gigantopelta aegis]|uniref:ficolin-1-A-like isoform X2 n=1 Tax=Gigantopelta aegis TaxID=1735272 RepID=UPI001B88C7FF|nr:ficolin-1-A-like isoform X2 [Gigantopelta aegis]